MEPSPVQVTVRPKRPLRDWRLWAVLGGLMALALIAISFWVLIDARNTALEEVESLSSSQQCYRTAAADTTAASAQVQVDLAEFVVLSLADEPVHGLADDMAMHARELSDAIGRQRRALESCDVDSKP